MPTTDVKASPRILNSPSTPLYPLFLFFQISISVFIFMESLAAIPWSDIYNNISDDHLLSLTDLLHHDDDNDNDTAASPLFLVPQVAYSDRATMLPVPGSTAYFGPTIGAVENALSITPRSRNLQSNTHIPRTTAG